MVILGIDPGLRATGYGLVEVLPEALRFVAAGDIRPRPRDPLAQRLGRIHEALSRLMSRHRPEVAVLEKIFTHAHHVTTATLMGHARGVACLAAQEQRVPVAEYPPTQVKKSLTGNGHASKEQVGRMVGQWLGGVEGDWSADASDALALAIIHAHVVQQGRNLPLGARA